RRRRDGHLVAARGEPLGDLAHHLLDAADARRIELAAEQDPHAAQMTSANERSTRRKKRAPETKTSAVDALDSRTIPAVSALVPRRAHRRPSTAPATGFRENAQRHRSGMRLVE